MLNKEAYQYYRITGPSYKALENFETPFMNLGLWPASSIRGAQSQLLDLVLKSIPSDAVQQILELGPGWGGSRHCIYEAFPQAVYYGVNLSSDQISYAQNLNQSIPETYYIEGFFEQLVSLNLKSCDTMIAVESLLHVKDKMQVMRDCQKVGMRKFVLAEICIEETNLIEQFPLFNPSLKYTWTSAQYKEYFQSNEYQDVRIIDISDKVFGGWSQALNHIDESQYRGPLRVLKQFKDSYSVLSDLSSKGLVKYLLISGRVRGTHGA